MIHQNIPNPSTVSAAVTQVPVSISQCLLDKAQLRVEKLSQGPSLSQRSIESWRRGRGASNLIINKSPFIPLVICVPLRRAGKTDNLELRQKKRLFLLQSLRTII